MVSYEELDTIGLLKRFMEGRIVRANEVGVDEFAALSPQELLEFLGNHLTPQGLTAGFGGMIALVDGLIHRQDIQRALGQPRTIPVDRLGRVLGLVPGNPRLGAGRRMRGLRLRHRHRLDARPRARGKRTRRSTAHGDGRPSCGRRRPRRPGPSDPGCTPVRITLSPNGFRR